MYLSHYNLKIKPFQISTDPRFLWLGENHKEALAILKYGIMDNRGFLLLTGDVGTGKTTLINALINNLGEEVITAFVPDPTLDKIDFFNYISNAFGIKKKYNSKGDFIEVFKKFLNRAYSNQKKVLLLIDESHRLTHDLLEEIRLLSNIERQNAKLINIFFIGQIEFNNLLWERQNRALKQRLTISYNISPLTTSETGEYIRHRLKVAGTERAIFSPTAINEIHAFSNGLPRMINIVCDHALLSGYVKGVSRISVKIVRECIKDLHIPRTLRMTDEADFDDTAQAGYGKQQEILKNQRPADQKEKKAGLFRRSAAYLGLGILVVITAGYFYYSGSLGFSMDKMARLWGLVKTEMNQPGSERSNRWDRQFETLQNPGPASKEEKFVEQGRHEEAAMRNQRGLAAGAPGITEADLASDDAGMDKISQGPTDDDRLYSNDTAGASTPDKVGSRAGTMGKFKKLYRVLILLEQRVTIPFHRNSNEISAEVIETLSEIAEVLIYYPGISIRVVGYTDSSGIYSYNKSLSSFRANIVKSYLVGKGVKREQIAAIGMGTQNPIGENTTRKGRKSNRRVEIMLDDDKSFSTSARP